MKLTLRHGETYEHLRKLPPLLVERNPSNPDKVYCFICCRNSNNK